jgi:DNA repair protein RecO (recombination protein O)
VDRLQKLPEFVLGDTEPDLADAVAGLRLTQHFLERDVFGSRHRPLPTARARLYDLLSDRLAEQEQKHAG